MPISERARLLPLVALAALAACGGGNPQAAEEQAASAGARDPERIACARGAAALARECTVERVASAEGLALVIHFPDGGFRRLKVATDGRGVIAADGAEPARVSIEGKDTILVAVGADRFRLPAHVKGE